MNDIANRIIGNLLARLIERIKEGEEIDPVSYITACLDMWSSFNDVAIMKILDERNKETKQ